MEIKIIYVDFRKAFYLTNHKSTWTALKRQGFQG